MPRRCCYRRSSAARSHSRRRSCRPTPRRRSRRLSPAPAPSSLWGRARLGFPACPGVRSGPAHPPGPGSPAVPAGLAARSPRVHRRVPVRPVGPRLRSRREFLARLVRPARRSRRGPPEDRSSLAVPALPGRLRRLARPLRHVLPAGLSYLGCPARLGPLVRRWVLAAPAALAVQRGQLRPPCPSRLAGPECPVAPARRRCPAPPSCRGLPAGRLRPGCPARLVVPVRRWDPGARAAPAPLRDPLRRRRLSHLAALGFPAAPPRRRGPARPSHHGLPALLPRPGCPGHLVFPGTPSGPDLRGCPAGRSARRRRQRLSRPAALGFPGPPARRRGPAFPLRHVPLAVLSRPVIP